MFRRNVLIFHAAALGDFVLSFPLALGLGRLYPQSRVIYVTHGQKGRLAEAALGVESRDIEEGWHHLLADRAALPQAGRRLLEGAQRAVSFQAGREGGWAEAIRTAASAIEVIALDPRPGAPAGRHVSAHLLDQLDGQPAMRAATEQMVRWLNSHGLPLRREPRWDALIHPGSGGQDKCWPVQRYLELAKRLKAGAGGRVAFVIGEVELERMTAGALGRLEEVAEVHRPQTYVELMKLLLGSRSFIGNDSGPGHLAGVLGLPTLCLFGPTDPAVWRPLGPRVEVIREKSLMDLPVDRVLEAARGLLP